MVLILGSLPASSNFPAHHPPPQTATRPSPALSAWPQSTILYTGIVPICGPRMTPHKIGGFSSTFGRYLGPSPRRIPPPGRRILHLQVHCLKMTNIHHTFSLDAQTGTAKTVAWKVTSRLLAVLAPSSLKLQLARGAQKPPGRNTSRIITVSKNVEALKEYFPAPLSLPRVPVLHPPLSTLESGHCQMIGRFFFPIQPGPPLITSKKTTIFHQVSILPSVPPDHISTRRKVLRTGWRPFLRANRPLKPSSPLILSNSFPHLSKINALHL